MSIRDRNNYIQILHRNKVPRSHIGSIMEDIDASGVFEDEDDEQIMDDIWAELEREAEVIFGDKSGDEKVQAFLQLKQEKQRSLPDGHPDLSSDERVRRKQEEIAATGYFDKKKRKRETTPRTKVKEVYDGAALPFGRSPLHQYIALRDLKNIEKCVKNRQYLDCLDNNGHNPYEMAWYNGDKEIMAIFEKHLAKSRK